MSAQHTPGPWEVAPNWPHGMTAVCHHTGTGWELVATALTEADARLISAAPALLGALQDLFGADMEHVLRGDGKEDQIEAIAKARAAITAATKEST